MPARTVLITGCSSGIGLDAARVLAARGWRVFATCRRAADCARLEAEGLESFPLDHDDPASLRAAVGTALERVGGGLDALVVNGAFALPGAVEDVPRDGLRAIFETNLFGPFELIGMVLPAMRARGVGRIVTVSSVLGYVSASFRGPYCATKHAVEAMSDALRLELRGSGIEVVVIEPGPITSRLRRNAVVHFERWIDWRGSALRDTYEAKVLPRLHADPGSRDRFELPPAAVSVRLVHALESRRPRARYRVTVPAHAGEAMRRLLPTRLRDRILSRG